MTLGFVVSFGGLVLVFVVLLVIEQLLIWRRRRPGPPARTPAVEVAASLDRAELAVREVEAELARVRAHLRAS